MIVRQRGTGRLRRALYVCALVVPLAACSAPGVSLQELPKFSESLGPSYPVRATFAEVLNLPADAQVRVGPQVVGRVGSIDTKNFVAELRLDIKEGVQLPVGTTAQVRFDNPLGDQYIQLTPPLQPTAQMLGPGAPLEQANTTTAASVEDSFAALSAVLNGGGINQLQTIIRELNANFDGNQQQIRDLLQQVDTLVTSLAEGRGAVVGALEAIDRLSTQLNKGSKTITAGIDELAPAIGVLAAETDEFSTMLTNFAELSDVASRLIQKSGENSVEGARSLLPVLDQLVGVKQRLGQDLRDIAEFQRRTVDKAPGDYLQVGLTLNVVLPKGAYSPTASGSALRTPPAGSNESAVRGLLNGGLR